MLMASHSNIFSISDTEIPHTTQRASSPAIYTNADEGTADKQARVRHEQTAKEVWRRVLSRTRAHALQLHGFLGIVMFIAMAVLVTVIIAVTWELTYQPVSRGFHEAHWVHIDVIKARCNVTALGMARVGDVLASMWVNVPAVQNPSTISESVLCNIVQNTFVGDTYIRGNAFLSESLNEMRVCYQYYDQVTDEPLLADVMTQNGVFQRGAYLVDTDTRHFHEPLTEAFAIPQDSITIPKLFATNPLTRQLIDEGFAYRAGRLKAFTKFLMWEVVGAKPIHFFYSYPVATYDTAEALAAGTPDGRAVVQTRLGMQRFFEDMGYTNTSRAMLLDARGLRAGESNPYLVAASWMAKVANDTSVFSFGYFGNIVYTRLNDITDEVMLAGLKHVKMSDFRSNAFDKTKSFHYYGAQSIVTWGNYTTEEGLSMSYVLVDTAGPVRGFPLLKAAAIACCAVFLALAIPLIFVAVVDVLFGQPMRTVARSLTRAGELGNKKARRHIRDDALIVISEVGELVDAHNEAVDILRAVEAYLPPALFGEGDGDGDGTESFNGSVSGTSGTLDSSRNFASTSGSFFDSVASTVAHRTRESGAMALTQMRVTVVTLHPVARPAAGHAVTPRRDDNTDRPAACGLEALRALDRETYNAPTPAFHSRWAVQDYAAVVLQAAEQRHGTVLRLAPELTVVCFGGTMEALTRGSADAAALAPTLEAKACATDALAAVQFAQDVRSRLQQLAARDSTNVPDVVAVVETSAYHVGVCRVAKLQQSLSVAVGASLAQMCAPPRKMAGGCALATTTTAQLLMHRLRFVPRCVLHVCSRHAAHAMYATEIVHQMLDGHADTQSWRAQCGLLLKALECLHTNDFARALTYLQRVPAAARGDMSLMSGERLGAVMRAAADTGVASAQLYGTVQSTVLADLVRFCEVHLRDPQAANAVLTPASYLDVLARCLPPLPTANGAPSDVPDDSLDNYPSVQCHSAAATNLAHLICALPPPTMAVPSLKKGVSGQTWLVPLHARNWTIEQCSPLNPLLMSTTGSISQVEPIELQPDALTTFSRDQLRAFTRSPESPFLVCIEDLLIFAADHRVLVAHEFVSYPVASAFRNIFPHESPAKFIVTRHFCLVSALACLDLHGYVHPRLSLHDVVLFPSGVAKLKLLYGAPRDLLECFVVPPSHFMSPEEAAGEYPTIVSNVYSNAVMAIEFLTRRLPYRWTAAAAADRVEAELTALQERCGPEFAAALAGGLIEVAEIPEDLEVPESVRRILHMCLQRDPALRPRPRDVLRLYRADPYLGPLVSDLPSGPWEAITAPCPAQNSRRL